MVRLHHSPVHATGVSKEESLASTAHTGREFKRKTASVSVTFTQHSYFRLLHNNAH